MNTGISGPNTEAQERRMILFLMAALFVISVIPYLPATLAPWSVSDDLQYVKRNPYIQEITLANIWAILTKPYNYNYLPLHLFSYMLDHVVFGNEPVGYRIENYIWHALSVLMLFVILRRLIGRADAALAGALFFGIHPACVESVTWVSERKNVLSQVFCLLSFWFYIVRHEKRGAYVWSVVAAFAAFFSKPSVVVLPPLLIIYQWLLESERNWKKLLLDKIPYFIFALVTGIVTVLIQNFDPKQSPVRSDSVVETLMNMVSVWARYVRMAIIPIWSAAANDESKWGISVRSGLAAMLIFALIAVALSLYKRRPLATFGIIWFFVALLPISSIFPLPVVLKDRYLYLPLVGVAMIVGDIFRVVLERNIRPGRALVAAMAICLFALTTYNSWIWRTPITTWEQAVKVAPSSLESNNDLATAYMFEHRANPMIERNGIAEAIKKGLSRNRRTAARLYLDSGKGVEALYMATHLARALPNDPQIYTTMGMAELMLGKHELAEKTLAIAIENGSREALSYMGMGILASMRGDSAQAIKWLKKALEINPDQVDARLQLATLLEKSNPKEAIIHFERVLVIKPDHPSWQSIASTINRLKRENP